MKCPECGERLRFERLRGFKYAFCPDDKVCKYVKAATVKALIEKIRWKGPEPCFTG